MTTDRWQHELRWKTGETRPNFQLVKLINHVQQEPTNYEAGTNGEHVINYELKQPIQAAVAAV